MLGCDGRDVSYSQSFRVAASGSGAVRLRVFDTLALVLSRLLPRCNRLMCRTTAVALNACWIKKKTKTRKKKKMEVKVLLLLLSWLFRVVRSE